VDVVAKKAIGQRLEALETVRMSGCPSCAQHEANAPAITARLRARVAALFDPESCRGWAVELRAEADRRAALRKGCPPEDMPRWLEAELNAKQRRRDKSERTAGAADKTDREVMEQREDR
jgi:hypothetical protein